MVLLLLLWLLEVLLLHLAELPLGPQKVTFISHNPTTMAQGILPEEIRRKLEAPVSDLLYMLLTCHALVKCLLH